MNWIKLNSLDQLTEIKKKSKETPQIIFKHSTRCSISSMALNRLEKAKTLPLADFYYLDLIAFRNISNSIAEQFDVYHESPQVLLIKNEECIYDESHSGITMDELIDQVSQLN